MFLMLKYALLSATVLMLVALGGCFSEHSGVINLALEGIMVIGGLVGTMALNLLPAEIIFGGEFLYRLPLAGVAVLLLCGVILWLLWYACYRCDVDAWDAGKRGIEYDMLRRRHRRAAVRIFVLITSLLLLIPSLYGIHVLRADQARTVTAFYETYYETDSSFLVDLEASGLLGSL